MDKNDSFLVFAFIFGVFGLAIWGLLRYTDDTVGKNSPLKVHRSYQISALQYFTRLYNFPVYYSGLLGLYCFIQIPDTFSRSVYLFDWKTPAILFLTALIIMGFSVCYLYLELNYWRHTKNIQITFWPQEKTVEINFPEKIYILKEGDLVNIETVGNGGRVQFAYSIYTLKNGDLFILTDRVPGTWAIQEYFKKIPIKFTEKRFPLIK